MSQHVRLHFPEIFEFSSYLHSQFCVSHFLRSVKADPSDTSEEEIEDVFEMLPANSNLRRKATLRKQFSVLEVPHDQCGFKMTHWV